jgi:hypothetical protein
MAELQKTAIKTEGGGKDEEIVEIHKPGTDRRNGGSSHVLFGCDIRGRARTGRTVTSREWSRARSE